MECITIANSRFKALALTVCSLGFVAGGLFILSKADVDDTWIGWTAVTFFGACALVGIWMLLDARPRLVIDDSGIYDRTIGIGKIPWSEIEGAYIRSIQGNDFICLKLRNQDAYLDKLSSVKRSMVKANEALGFTPISLNLSGVAADSDQILELVLKYSELYS